MLESTQKGCCRHGTEQATVTMGRSRMFRVFVVLGSAFMILLIIIYWDDVGASHLYLHTPVSPGPKIPHPPPQQRPPQTSRTPSFLSDIDAFVNQFLEPGTGEPTDPVPADTSNQSDKAEERYIPRREWKIHLTPIAAELRERQEHRRRLLQEMCANDSVVFPGKNRSFDDIPNKELDHLIVDDRHGIIYCYVPKVKLKKYTKFLFVRDPFVRLISAYRNKFELRNEDFYRRFAQVMLRRYANQPTPPASVDEAFDVGIHPSFSHFIQYLLDPQTEKEAPFNEHWRQVYRLCHPCQIQYDFVGHLETVEEDAEHLLRQLRVDNVVEFPTTHRNLTASSWEADWFSTVPVKARQELYKLYEPDFRLFGYDRPDSILNE
ncbi:hypothetical protein L3Q82_014407 [Scortum barcoo]|uniref:Uncharacterized protein n=1 Tax=Scortum barcoo TaxID=214431 RepID=A0ACB8VX13_9TELE|nr:hypothetical protein L3Q82_014407 [Scortum barcoo]